MAGPPLQPGVRPALPPALGLAVGLVAVSTAAILIRLVEAPAGVVAFWRTALAVLVLLPFAGPRLVAELPGLPARHLAGGIVAGVFLALHFATWIASLDHTTVASSVVMVTTTPLWAGLLMPLLGAGRPPRRLWQAIALSVGGGLVIGAGDLRVSGSALWGDFLALAGAWCVTFYLLAGSRLRPHLSLLPYLVVCYGVAALVLLALAVGQGLPLLGWSARTMGLLLALAIVPQLIGHTSINWALAWVSPAFVAVVLVGEPVLSALWAWWLLDEPPPLATVCGGALLLAGIARAAGAAGPAVVADQPSPPSRDRPKAFTRL